MDDKRKYQTETILKGKPITLTFDAVRHGDGVEVDFDGSDIHNPHKVVIDQFDAIELRKFVNAEAEKILDGEVEYHEVAEKEAE